MLYLIDVLDDPQMSVRDCFAEFFSTEDLSPQYEVIDGINNHAQFLTLLDDKPAGILISGSIHSAYEHLDWIQALKKLIQETYERNIPTFGVCFGHQIIAAALGGKVERLPNMREYGVMPVFLAGHDSHPYLESFQSGTLTLQTHQDHVSVLPPGAQQLGFSNITENQIFTKGSCFGIQFHPEYRMEHLRFLGQVRRDVYLREKLFNSPSHLDNFLATLSLFETKQSHRILANFIRSLKTPLKS